MRFRFWRRVRLFPGLTINLSKRGASVSVGPRRAKLTVGGTGMRTTVGIPGTGVWFTEHRPWHGKSALVENLPAQTQLVANKRAPFWEFVLIADALNQRIEEINRCWRESTEGQVGLASFCRWGEDHLHALSALINKLIDLLQVDLVAAVGPPGQPGNEEKIVEVIECVVAVMKQVAQWEQVVRLMSEHPVYGSLASKMSGMPRPILDMIDEFRAQHLKQLATVAETRRFNIHIKMDDLPNVGAVIAGMQQFAARALEECAILGDFYQTHFRVRRESTELGMFSRSAVIENLQCGLFQTDDTYWSDNLQKWRSLPELENDVELTNRNARTFGTQDEADQ
jgi:hypothetical protein